MSSTDWLMLLVVVVLFLISMVLALAEMAFNRMNRIRAITLEEEGRKGAAKLARMLERPEQTINSLLLLILVSQLTAASLVGIVLERQLGGYGVAAGLVVQIVLFFAVGEVAPKTYAIQHTDRAALAMSGLLHAITNFPPLRAMSRGLIGLANVLLPGKGIKEGPFVTEDDLRTMADVAADEEAIEREERRLIHSIFEFGDTVVREVMLPRPDMVAIEADATIEEAIEAAIDGGFSASRIRQDARQHRRARVPEGPRRSRRRVRARSRCARLLRPAVFVPEQKRVAELLREMQTQQFHMAIVVDEHGGTAGLVTLEDLLEEIVGEITDEYDVEAPGVEHLPNGDVRVPGRLSMHDLSEELGIELPDTRSGTPSAVSCSTCSVTCPSRARRCASRAWRSTPSACRGGASRRFASIASITPTPTPPPVLTVRPVLEPTRGPKRWPTARRTSDGHAGRLSFGVRGAGRASERRQVDAGQPARRHEGHDHVAPPTDHAHDDPGRAHHADDPARAPRHARDPQAADLARRAHERARPRHDRRGRRRVRARRRDGIDRVGRRVRRRPGARHQHAPHPDREQGRRGIQVGRRPASRPSAGRLGEFDEYVALSALTGEGVEVLTSELESRLQEGPRFYPDGVVTDQPETFLAAELLREQLLTRTREELPHSITVSIEELEDDGAQHPEDVLRLGATIFVERDSQKGIVIGRGGVLLKEAATAARHELEALLGTRVYLEVAVRVERNWQRRPQSLDRLGY